MGFFVSIDRINQALAGRLAGAFCWAGIIKEEKGLGLMLQQRADMASAATVSLSGITLWTHNANAWVNEFMPLITAFGIISGTVLTAWYYWQSIEQRKRDRAAKHKQMDQERELANRRDGLD